MSAAPPHVRALSDEFKRLSVTPPQAEVAAAQKNPLDGVPTARDRRDSTNDRSQVASSARDRSRQVSREGELVRFNTVELSRHESRRQIYALIVVTDRLERAWLKGAIPTEVYEARCYELINKFLAAKKAFVGAVPDLERFAVEFRLDADHGYPLGYHRLIVAGLPATKEGPAPAATDQKRQQKVASRCTASFITLLDLIEMGQTETETLVKYVQELLVNLNSMDGVQGNLTLRQQIEAWSKKLHRMGVGVNLTELEIRELKLDVELGYAAFQQHFED
jgi:ESCRT-I complex subunit VPS28